MKRNGMTRPGPCRVQCAWQDMVRVMCIARHVLSRQVVRITRYSPSPVHDTTCSMTPCHAHDTPWSMSCAWRSMVHVLFMTLHCPCHVHDTARHGPCHKCMTRHGSCTYDTTRSMSCAWHWYLVHMLLLQLAGTSHQSESDREDSNQTPTAATPVPGSYDIYRKINALLDNSLDLSSLASLPVSADSPNGMSHQ